MQPMLATPGALPIGPEWTYEVKWDGMRVLAEVADGALRLASRSGRDVTGNFPELAGLAQVAPDVLLDGEVVLLDGGVPSFAALADRIHGPVDLARALARPVVYMVFDVLRLYGVELLDRPLAERRATLERLDTSAVRAVELSPVYADGPTLLAATAERGMEGVVAKRHDAVYRPGRRSPSWVKVTHQRTESCLVGGWRPERTNPGRIGALLLGVPVADGAVRFAGRVGAGLTAGVVQRTLRDRLSGIAVDGPPFLDPVPRVDADGAHWCAPTLVVDVDHLGRTEGGRLRQPVFRGLRDDLEPADIRPGS